MSLCCQTISIMLRNYKMGLLFRNLLPKSVILTIHKAFKNLLMKVRGRKDLQESSSSPPTDIRKFTHASVFLTNFEGLFLRPKHHKAKFPFRSSLPKAISYIYAFLKKICLALALGFSVIYKVFRSLILKVKTRNNLQKASSNPPANVKRNAFLTHLGKTFSGPIDVFTTYIEQSLSLKEHLNLISLILVKALVTGIVSCMLVFVILGFVLLLF